MLTTKTLVSKYPGGIDCKICTEVADSHLELIARSALQSAGIPFQVYAKPLGGKFGCVDIFIADANFIVAVDGPGHVEEDCRSAPLQVQQAIDRFAIDGFAIDGFAAWLVEIQHAACGFEALGPRLDVAPDVCRG